MNVIPREIEHLAREVMVGLRRYRNAKDRYVRTTALLAEPMDHEDSEANAADREQAIKDCQWYQADVQTNASALTALCLSQMGEPRA